MERDLRGTPLFEEVERFYTDALGPGFGKVTSFGTPVVSPDGRWVAVSGERLDKLEGHGQGRIVLAAADGSGARQITEGPNEDAEPRWSPDATRLSFRSDRASKGRFQLYVLETGQLGEARRLGEVAGVVEHHRWSPEGERILMVVAGTHAEQADALGSGTLGGEEEAPAWIPDVESSDDADEWRRLWILDVGSGEAKPVSAEGVNVWEATWCGPDAVAAIVSNGPSEGDWYFSSLVLVDVATGQQRVLLETDVQLGMPEGSPTGSCVAVVEAVCSDRYIVAGELHLVDLEDGGSRSVALDADATWLAWRDDGRLLVMGLDGFDAVALDVDTGSGTAIETWRSPDRCGDWYPAAAPLGSGFVAVQESWRRPPELVSVSDGSDRVLARTEHPGHDVVRGAFASREHVAWRAADDLEIHGLLTLPHGEAPFPLIVDVHGGPVWAFQDALPGAGEALLLSRGYALFQPNPRGSGGRGREFAAQVVGDMGGADAHDILRGVGALIERGVADPERIGVAGGSYGGYMACWLPVLDQRFKASVSISPVTDWYSERFASSLGTWAEDFLGGSPAEAREAYDERSPVLKIERVVTPTLLTAGVKDRATPRGQAVEFYRALRARGVATEVVVYGNEGHGVRSFPGIIDLQTRALAWFERFMPAR